MKSGKLGILSALVASICCLGPVLLIFLGLGSLGIGAAIGKYHWYFITGAVVLLVFSWRDYLKDKKTCALEGCRVENKKITMSILLTATLVVAIFAGLNLYTYAGGKGFSNVKRGSEIIEGKTDIIPVKGMTCVSCEFAVSSALKKVDGVTNAMASAKEGKAQVTYDPSKTNVKELIETINKTGYKAGAQTK